MAIRLAHHDFRRSTWLITGACLHSILLLLLPVGVVAIVPFLLLLYRAVPSILTHGFGFPFPSKALAGRWTARFPKAQSLTDSEHDSKDVVVFILGARTLSPLGRLAPGFQDSKVVFVNMFKDAMSNRKKYGFLGRTDPMYQEAEDGSMTMVWITYWQNLEGLRDFAAGDAHRVGWNNYVAKKYPNLGVMHETYSVPAGSWETIYHNFHRFGLADAKVPLESPSEDLHIKTGMQFQEMFLSEVKDAKLGSMFKRMGRE